MSIWSWLHDRWDGLVRTEQRIQSGLFGGIGEAIGSTLSAILGRVSEATGGMSISTPFGGFSIGGGKKGQINLLPIIGIVVVIFIIVFVVLRRKK
jgi:hypothetical protein